MHIDNDVALISALVSAHGHDVADLALVNHAMSEALVAHTTGAYDTSYTLLPEKFLRLKIRTGDAIRIQVADFAMGSYSVNCDLAPIALVAEETYNLCLSQTKGILLPKRTIFDDSELDALFGEEGVLV